MVNIAAKRKLTEYERRRKLHLERISSNCALKVFHVHVRVDKFVLEPQVSVKGFNDLNSCRALHVLHTQVTRHTNGMSRIVKVIRHNLIDGHHEIEIVRVPVLEVLVV